MKLIRLTYRLILLIFHILLGIVLAAFRLRGSPDTPPAPQQRDIIAWWLGQSASIVGLKIVTRGTVPDVPVLAVANHVSWLDILIMSAVLPVSFVSKIEVKHWPVVGWLATRARTLYIQRGGKNAANTVTEQITWFLLRHRSVAIFPEGTTGDGHGVRRFHPRLFGAAIHAHTPVQPVAIRFPHPQGVNPAVPFLNDESLVRSALRVLGQRSIHVEVTFCRLLPSKHAERSSLAKKAHAAIEKVVRDNLPSVQEARNE